MTLTHQATLAERAPTEHRIASLQQQLDLTTSHCDSLTAELTVRSDTLYALQRQHSTTTATLQSQIDALTEQVTTLQRSLTDSQQECAALRLSQTESAQRLAEEQNASFATVSRYQAEIESLQRVDTLRKSAMDKANARIAELETAHNDVTRLYNEMSEQCATLTSKNQVRTDDNKRH